MPLANEVHGASLVPDLSQGINAISQGIMRHKQQKAQEAQQEQISTTIDRLKTADSPGAEEEIFLDMSKLMSPQEVAGVRAIIERGNEQEIAAFKAKSVEATKFFNMMEGIKDPAQRVKAVRERIQAIQARMPTLNPQEQAEAQAEINKLLELGAKSPGDMAVAIFKGQLTNGTVQQGVDIKEARLKGQAVAEQERIDRIAKDSFEISQLPAPDQILEIRRRTLEGEQRGENVDHLRQLQEAGVSRSELMQSNINRARKVEDVIGGGVGERFEPVFNRGGEIVGQRSTTTGKVISDPRAVPQGGAKGQFSAKTEILKDGTTIQAAPTGEVVVRDRSGKIVEGAARLSALDASRQFQLDLVADKADIKLKRALQKQQGIKNIDLQMEPRIKGAVKTVSQRLDASKAAADSLPAINKDIELYTRAIDAVRRGAGTGPIENMMPTLRAATFELQNIQQQLGLNLLSSVTMGALSEREMDILLSTSIPTGMDDEELIEWLQERRSASVKMRDFTENAVAYFSDPEHTVAGFVAKTRRDREAQAPRRQSAPSQPKIRKFNPETRRFE